MNPGRISPWQTLRLPVAVGRRPPAVDGRRQVRCDRRYSTAQHLLCATCAGLSGVCAARLTVWSAQSRCARHGDVCF